MTTGAGLRTLARQHRYWRHGDQAGFVTAHGQEPSPEQITAHDRQRELGASGERRFVSLFRSGYPPAGLVVDAGGGTGGDLGLELAAVHEIDGHQQRSVRDVIATRSSNPFIARASSQAVAVARTQTLAWAAGRYGDLDAPRDVRVRRILHDFRRRAEDPPDRSQEAGSSLAGSAA